MADLGLGFEFWRGGKGKGAVEELEMLLCLLCSFVSPGEGEKKKGGRESSGVFQVPTVEKPRNC